MPLTLAVPGGESRAGRRALGEVPRPMVHCLCQQSACTRNSHNGPIVPSRQAVRQFGGGSWATPNPPPQKKGPD